jgi:hypothetical protein
MTLTLERGKGLGTTSSRCVGCSMLCHRRLAHSFAVKYPYDTSEALKDLPGITYALDIFLASHMFEAEDYCHKSDPKKYVGHLNWKFRTHEPLIGIVFTFPPAMDSFSVSKL